MEQFGETRLAQLAAATAAPCTQALRMAFNIRDERRCVGNYMHFYPLRSFRPYAEHAPEHLLLSCDRRKFEPTEAIGFACPSTILFG